MAPAPPLHAGGRVHGGPCSACSCSSAKGYGYDRSLLRFVTIVGAYLPLNGRKALMTTLPSVACSHLRLSFPFWSFLQDPTAELQAGVKTEGLQRGKVKGYSQYPRGSEARGESEGSSRQGPCL